MSKPKARILAAVAATIASLSASAAHAAVLFYDGYSVSAQSNNVDFENNLRQTGTVGALAYAQSPAFGSGFDWQSQVGNGGVPGGLLIVSGGPGGNTRVSPNHNFNSMTVGDTSMQISFDYTSATAGYSTSGFTLGSSTLAGVGSAGSFGITIIRDALFGAGNAFLFNDGATNVGIFANTPFDLGAGVNMTLNITDVLDNDPWNGVGSTNISVSVNGTLLGSYSKGSGGYTNNFMTISGLQNDNGGGDVVGVNRWDNLTVTTIPEPSGFALTALGLGILLRRRRA